MKVSLSGIRDAAAWEKAGVVLPRFDILKMRAATREKPVWVHFGAGNIFRAFIADLQQRLLDSGDAECGIIAADTFDVDNIRMIYGGYDNLTMAATLNADATVDLKIIASVAEALVGQTGAAEDWARLTEIFENPALQMVSFTITEKGYALLGLDGKPTKMALADMENGPDKPVHCMSAVTALLYRRYRKNGAPVAVVSMDNCSHNGEKLKSAVLKITPRPAPSVRKILEDKGIEDMAPILTPRGTYLAPFVNAEKAQYLVVEDRFPNGRPPLEKAGVYMTDRDTVNRTERMKVTTCLNPLHTALAAYGCLLGYDLIADEMKDADLTRLVETIGYREGLPVVTDPGILSPKAFIDEVLTQRLPNPFMPDTPQRIATDTSQKVPIRFGETIKSYMADPRRDPASLIGIPLALAGWLRYLVGLDDEGREMPLSDDPMLEELRGALAGVKLGDPASCEGKLDAILKNPVLFGVDLYEAGLGKKVEELFAAEMKGPGAVRAVLKEALALS